LFLEGLSKHTYNNKFLVSDSVSNISRTLYSPEVV
jgi:hypothetical protein